MYGSDRILGKRAVAGNRNVRRSARKTLWLDSCFRVAIRYNIIGVDFFRAVECVQGEGPQG